MGIQGGTPGQARRDAQAAGPRSDLDWMLREIEDRKVRRQIDALESHVDQPPELGATGRVTTDPSDQRRVDHEKIMSALKELSQADEDLAAARAASETHHLTRISRTEYGNSRTAS